MSYLGKVRSIVGDNQTSFQKGITVVPGFKFSFTSDKVIRVNCFGIQLFLSERKSKFLLPF